MLVGRLLSCSVTQAILLAVFATAVTSAQDYESAAEAAIEYQGFPWQEAGELSELNRDDPGSAQSAQRNSVPQRLTQNSSLPKFSIPGTWFTFFNSLIGVIITALILTIAVILIWMFLRMDKRTSRHNKYEDYDEEEMLADRIKQLPFELKRKQPGNLSEQAQRLAEQGNYSRAMMFLFSHVLLQLDKHELIRLKRGKTNRQYLTELQSHHNISNYYRKVMISFEDAFFGNYDISQSRFDSCWNELNQFETNIDNAQHVATS